MHGCMHMHVCCMCIGMCAHVYVYESMFLTYEYLNRTVHYSLYAFNYSNIIHHSYITTISYNLKLMTTLQLM